MPVYFLHTTDQCGLRTCKCGEPLRYHSVAYHEAEGDAATFHVPLPFRAPEPAAWDAATMVASGFEIITEERAREYTDVLIANHAWFMDDVAAGLGYLERGPDGHNVWTEAGATLSGRPVGSAA